MHFCFHISLVDDWVSYSKNEKIPFIRESNCKQSKAVILIEEKI